MTDATQMSFVHTGLELAASRLFPAYRRLSDPQPLPEKIPIAAPIASNLPLQVLMYFNILFFPVWLTGMLSTIAWKIYWFDVSAFHKFLMCFMFSAFTLIEPLRLRLGYFGNLNEKVPELSGVFLFTLLPQIPAVIYFSALQPFAGWGFTTPFEIAVNLIYLFLFLLPESIFGYLAAKSVIRTQAALFVLRGTSDDPVPDENNGPGSGLIKSWKTEPLSENIGWMNESTLDGAARHTLASAAEPHIPGSPAVRTVSPTVNEDGSQQGDPLQEEFSPPASNRAPHRIKEAKKNRHIREASEAASMPKNDERKSRHVDTLNAEITSPGAAKKGPDANEDSLSWKQSQSISDAGVRSRSRSLKKREEGLDKSRPSLASIAGQQQQRHTPRRRRSVSQHSSAPLHMSEPELHTFKDQRNAEVHIFERVEHESPSTNEVAPINASIRTSHQRDKSTARSVTSLRIRTDNLSIDEPKPIASTRRDNSKADSIRKRTHNLSADVEKRSKTTMSREIPAAQCIGSLSNADDVSMKQDVPENNQSVHSINSATLEDNDIRSSNSLAASSRAGSSGSQIHLVKHRSSSRLFRREQSELSERELASRNPLLSSPPTSSGSDLFSQHDEVNQLKEGQRSLSQSSNSVSQERKQRFSKPRSESSQKSKHRQVSRSSESASASERRSTSRPSLHKLDSVPSSSGSPLIQDTHSEISTELSYLPHSRILSQASVLSSSAIDRSADDLPRPETDRPPSASSSKSLLCDERNPIITSRSKTRNLDSSSSDSLIPTRVSETSSALRSQHSRIISQSSFASSTRTDRSTSQSREVDRERRMLLRLSRQQSIQRSRESESMLRSRDTVLASGASSTRRTSDSYSNTGTS